MNIKDAVHKAIYLNANLREDILCFSNDHTRKCFIKSVMDNDKEGKYRAELYQYLSGVAQFYIYQVSIKAIEILGNQIDDNEFLVAIDSMVAKPILKDVADESNKAVEEIMREYDEDRKRRGAEA